MKPIAISVAACVALFGACGCKKKEEPKKFSPRPLDIRNPKLAYPFEKTLKDSQGREIRAIIVGRTISEIIFQRPGSPKRYRYAIRELSTEDRDFIRTLPKDEWRPDSEKVKSLKAELRRLEEKMAEIQAEIDKTPRAQTRNRALERQIIDLSDKAEKIRIEIAALQKEEFGS